MPNLNDVVDSFVEEAVRLCIENLREDEPVIRALNDATADAKVRRAQVLKWLRSYSVLSGLNGDD